LLVIFGVAGYGAYRKIYPLTAPVSATQAEKYFEMGNDARAQGDLKTALLNYKKALRGGNKPEYLQKYAEVAYRLHDYDDSITSYALALKQKSDDAVIWNAIGNAQRDGGKAQDAILSYQRAIEIDKNYIVAYSNLINLYVLQSNPTEAKKTLDLGLANNPSDKDLLAIKKNIKWEYINF